MTVSIILSVLSALLALLPIIIKLIDARKVKVNALRKRSLDELHIATDSVLNDSNAPVQPE